jgi:uncharacterized protein with von Willebrand factor type A (vWA) domain
MEGARIVHDVVGLARALRDADMRVGVDQGEAFARALGWIDPLSRREVYLAARASLVHRREDLPVFDAIFSAYWLGREGKSPQKAPLAPRHDPSPFHRSALVSYMAEKAKPTAPDVDVPDAKAATDVERLQTKDFSDLSAEERAELVAAIRALRIDPAKRLSRRRTPSRRGDELDLPRILRQAARSGGTPIALLRRRRKIKRRPIVILADISGSMELYTRVLLTFLHALTHAHGLCETFVFGTRLTNITTQLRVRDVDRAIDDAARQMLDYAGGTRIGESLRTFNRLHGPRVLRRGAIVLVVSDGWETGGAQVLDRELRRLKGRCHRLIWLNPLLGRGGYEPLAEGMVASLPHIDDFLPIGNMQSLRHLSEHLARVPRRKLHSSAKAAATRRGLDEASG